MNVSAMKWLLANRQALLDCIELAKGWTDTLPYPQKWDIVDKIARRLIPLIEPAKAKALWLDGFDTASPATSAESYPVMCMSIGADCQALGLDWKLIVEVILPIVISILQALAKNPAV
jgi:hypothetical protein